MASGWRFIGFFVLGLAGIGLGTRALRAQTFRSGVDLVVLQVTVTDGDGRVVTGLLRDDFAVREDGVDRPIEQFSTDRAPISLGILVDVSGSMAGGRFANARQALGKLLDRFHQDDQIFISVFNTTFRLLVPWSNDHEALLRALSGVTPQSGTFLYSSISAALPVLEDGINRKKALVVISDGDDNEKMAGMNRGLLARAVQQARRSEALIYVIGIGAPKPSLEQWFALDADTRRRFFYDPPVDVEQLRQLSDPTGGYTQLVPATGDLTSTVVSIADDLGSQYMIGYQAASKSDAFHTVKVMLRGHPGYHVRARTGYVNQ